MNLQWWEFSDNIETQSPCFARLDKTTDMTTPLRTVCCVSQGLEPRKNACHGEGPVLVFFFFFPKLAFLGDMWSSHFSNACLRLKYGLGLIHEIMFLQKTGKLQRKDKCICKIIPNIWGNNMLNCGWNQSSKLSNKSIMSRMNTSCIKTPWKQHIPQPWECFWTDTSFFSFNLSICARPCWEVDDNKSE